MHIVHHTDAGFAAQLVEAVRERGDIALAELTERFDGAKLAPAEFAVTTAELLGASLAADDVLRAAVAEAHKNILSFAKKSARRGWFAAQA